MSDVVTRIQATTSGRQDDSATSCALGEGAPDLVYALHVSRSSRLTARAIPLPGSAIRPVLELRASCAPADPGNVLACRWTQRPEDGARLSADVAPGTYYLWVDADFGSAGAFALEVSATPSAPGDSCLSTSTLLLNTDTLEVDGDTRGLEDDSAGYCGGAGAPDAVYRLAIQQKRRLRVTATSTSSGFIPVVYLRRPQQCSTQDGAAQLDCGVGYQGSATLDVPSLEPGIYSLFVDGAIDSAFVPTSGAFHLRIELLPPVPLAGNDRCEGAQPIVLPDSGSVSLSGDTLSALSDATSACGGSGPDLVYSFTLTQPRSLTVRVVPDSNAPFAPVAYLRTVCDSEQPEALVACNGAAQISTSATLQQGNLAAGTYFLWVDGLSQSRGKFTLKIDVAPALPAPVNDSCQSAAALTPTNGTSSVTGTTLAANDDASGCQEPSGSPSPDVVYELDVPVPSSVSLDVEALPGSTLRPVLFVDRGTCGAPQPTDRLFCAWGDPYSPERVVHTLGSVAPGKYYVWIDGDYTSSGPFSFKATLGPPVNAPTNDDCNTALALSWLSGAVTGDTRSAEDSTSGFCQPYLTGSGEGAGDVAFTFTMPTTRTVKLTVTPDPYEGKLFRPLVYVRGPDAALCSSQQPGDQLGCGVSPALGSPATLTLPNLAPGTYTVWVDGVGKTTGKFALSLQ